MNRKIKTCTTAGIYVVLAVLTLVPSMPAWAGLTPRTQGAGFKPGTELNNDAWAVAFQPSGKLLIGGIFPSQTIPNVEVLSGTVTPDFPLQPVVIVEGWVRDFYTWAPINDAAINTDLPCVAPTDPSGYYRMECPPGRTSFVVSAAGYFTWTDPGYVLITGTYTIDFFLYRVPTLFGRVIDRATLAPIAGARVAAGPYLETFTDPAGVYTITVGQEGHYYVSAQADGYIPQEIAVDLLPYGGWTIIDFNLERLAPRNLYLPLMLGRSSP